MKLVADVNVSRRVVERLRALGFEVMRVGEVMLHARAPDEEILAEAARLGAVLVSEDQDFSALLATSGAAEPSHINVRVSYVDPERLAAAIATVCRTARADLEAGAIVTIDDAGARLRQLPVR